MWEREIVCVRERETKIECMCVCGERERERERDLSSIGEHARMRVEELRISLHPPRLFTLDLKP